VFLQEVFIGMGRPNNPMRLPQSRIKVSDILAHFSPVLATYLVAQITGAAQRSELESICKPLRAFVFSVPNAKAHLEQAMNDKDFFKSGNVDDKDKRVFLAQIMSLRGGSKTNSIVKDFWARCKGTVISFE
jgi:hypothetical protein